jgi:hypothetical protein
MTYLICETISGVDLERTAGGVDFDGTHLGIAAMNGGILAGAPSFILAALKRRSFSGPPPKLPLRTLAIATGLGAAFNTSMEFAYEGSQRSPGPPFTAFGPP